ncbi:hypothetical protein [Streptomyces cavernicola]|uniref:Uncharacterized protein n=1 Tax=Streptomyces cavernicola TaxID=3043613 RepID=A0ABT6S5Q6_9ACTN|nr:hypothetical protein [Streptomyces sp. B-S-A6]MDI3403239.1 hypothetical protein [Streptomyces sp. B-S-A6]
MTPGSRRSLRREEYDPDAGELLGTGYDDHAAPVTSTAAELHRAGIGHRHQPGPLTADLLPAGLRLRRQHAHNRMAVAELLAQVAQQRRPASSISRLGRAMAAHSWTVGLSLSSMPMGAGPQRGLPTSSKTSKAVS